MEIEVDENKACPDCGGQNLKLYSQTDTNQQGLKVCADCGQFVQQKAGNNGEIDKHECEEADKGLKDMKVFLLFKLATDAKGNMKGSIHYHESELAPVSERIGMICRATADGITNLLPELIEVAHMAAQVQVALEQILHSAKEKAETNDNEISKRNGSREPTETPGILGDLKQHGRVVH